MSVDRREYLTPDTGAAARERRPIRPLVVAVVVLELVRVALQLLQMLVRPTDRIDPSTGLFSESDPLGGVRSLLPYVDVLAYIAVVVLLCLLFARLARRSGAGVGMTFGAAGVVLFFALVGVFLLRGTTWLSLVPLLALPAATPDGVTPLLLALAAIVAFVVLGIVLAARRGSASRPVAVGVAPHYGGAAPYATGAAPYATGAATDGTLRPVAGYDPSVRTNGLAIASLIVVFFSSLIGLILGHVALAQIRRTGEGGHGLALAAVIIGWVSTGIALIALSVVIVSVLMHAGSTY